MTRARNFSQLAGFALVLTAVHTEAWAQPSTLHLTWQAPAECPNREAVERTVTRLEGRLATLSAFDVTVFVSQTGDGYRATLQTESNGTVGERTFRASTCEQLAEAAALIIALAHCPDLATAPPPTARLDEPDPRSPPQPERLSAGAFVASDVGAQPSVSFGAGVDVSLHFGPFTLSAHGLRTVSQRAVAGPRADSGIEAQTLLGLGVRGCFRLVDARFYAGPCAGLDAVLISTTTSNIDVPASGSGWWVGGLAGGQVGAHAFQRVSVFVSAEVGAALTRPVFIVDGYGQVFRPGEVVGRLRVGLEVQLW